MSDKQTEIECPTCGRTDFKSNRGMKIHHNNAHDESIAFVTAYCNYCGDKVKKNPSAYRKTEGTYCDHSCYSKDKKEQSVCEYCGETHEKISQKYCSRKCFHKDVGRALPGNRNTTHCDNCATEFEIRPHREEKQKHTFCSKECNNEYFEEYYQGKNNPNYKGKVNVTCDECGTVYKVKPSIKNTSRFCSMDCKNKAQSWLIGGEQHHWWNEENTDLYYGENWAEIRKERLGIDDYECVVCKMGNDKHLSKFGCGLSVHHIIPLSKFEDVEKAHNIDNLITLCKTCHNKWEGIPLKPQTSGGGE